MSAHKDICPYCKEPLTMPLSLHTLVCSAIDDDEWSRALIENAKESATEDEFEQARRTRGRM